MAVLPRMWNGEASSTGDVIDEQLNLREIEMKENDSNEDFPGQRICVKTVILLCRDVL